MIEAKRLAACVLFLLGGLWVQAAEPDAETARWWIRQVPSSGFVPAGENPDFDKYMATSAPVRKGKDGKFVTDEIAAKGWDKTLKTFYMTLEVKPESPIRVGIPEIPSTLPARAMTAEDERRASQLHSDCKVLGIADGKVLEVTGKVGLAVSMGTMGYIVGLPGSRLDISGFTNKPFPLAGRQWRAKSAQRAYMLVTSDQILLVDAEQVDARAQADGAVTTGERAAATASAAPAQTKTKAERNEEAIQLVRSAPDQAGHASRRLAQLVRDADFGVRCQAAFTTVRLGQRLAEKIRSDELEKSLSEMISRELQTERDAAPTEVEITEGRGAVWAVRWAAPTIIQDTTIHEGEQRKNALFMGPCLYSGIQALGEIRARSKEVFDLMTRLAGSEDKTVRSVAAYAMATLDRPIADRLKVLQQRQDAETDERVRDFVESSIRVVKRSSVTSRQQQ